jgi:hypothetical protein
MHGGNEAAAKKAVTMDAVWCRLHFFGTEPEISMSFPSRRSFLQIAFSAIASFFLPRVLFAGGKSRSFWFLHIPTGETWAVDDPLAWCLANARQPILERASKGLQKLTPADDQRIVRLVVRRCKLNLIEIQPERVVVHYWGQQGRVDLRAFFKANGLARREIEVVLKDRKRELTTVQRGDDFLYGEKLGERFPVGVYLEKWRRRDVKEPDDWTAAPCSLSNYFWDGVEKGYIPWRVLKSAWRHENALHCRNCDQPTLLISFGYFTCGFYKRGSRVSRICPACRRRYEDCSPWDGPKWMMANLDETLLPTCDITFGKPVTLHWTMEAGS